MKSSAGFWGGLFMICVTAYAQDVSPGEASSSSEPVQAQAQKTEKAQPVAVAILDFAANDPSNPSLGNEIATALEAILATERGVRLVDRKALEKILDEQALNLTGLVGAGDAIKIGKLVGAQILVTGRVFPLGKNLFITAKLIGTETSLIDAAMVKGPSNSDLGELTLSLSQKVSDKLREGKVLPKGSHAIDPIPAFKKELSKFKLPTIAVMIREQHHAEPKNAIRQPVAPAVETEVKRILIEVGFKVKDAPKNQLVDVFQVGKPRKGWPRGLTADYLIAGKAFSEFAGRRSGLVSCSARAEVNVIQRKDGAIIHAGRVTSRAVDLSERIAGKTALQKAGEAIAIDFLEQYLKLVKPKSTPAER